jgi:hypothetical protein
MLFPHISITNGDYLYDRTRSVPKSKKNCVIPFVSEYCELTWVTRILVF